MFCLLYRELVFEMHCGVLGGGGTSMQKVPVQAGILSRISESEVSTVVIGNFNATVYVFLCNRYHEPIDESMYLLGCLRKIVQQPKPIDFNPFIPVSAKTATSQVDLQV